MTKVRCNTYLRKYILIVLFFPSFSGFFSGGPTVSQLLYTVMVAILGLFILFKSGHSFIFAKPYLILFLIQAFFYTLTLTVNVSNPLLAVSYLDYSNIFRPILYLICLSISLSLYGRYAKIQSFLNLMIHAIILMAVLDILKFFHFGQIIEKFYSAAEPGSFNYMRFKGTFGYSYNYGFVVLFALIYYLLKFKRSKFWLITCITILLFTGSRSVMLATASLMITVFVTSKTKIANKILILIISVFLLFVCFEILILLELPLSNEIFEYYQRLFEVFNGGSGGGSITTRTSQLSSALSNFYQNPIFGVGPLKETSAPIEIQFANYLSSWGLLGVLALISLYIISLFFAIKTSSRSVGEVYLFSKTNVLWILSSLIVGMSTPITDQIRVSQIFYFIQGIQYALYISTSDINYKYFNIKVKA